MERISKWWLAGLATLAAFSATTWICGALVLAAFRIDSPTRWGIAGGAGVAVAALAALWGASFASRSEDKTGEQEPTRPTATAVECDGVHNVIKGDVVGGSVLQGRDFHGPVTLGPNNPPRRPDLENPN